MSSLRKYIRKLLVESDVLVGTSEQSKEKQDTNPFKLSRTGQQALTRLCQLYYNAGDSNHQGLIGEQIAMVILGISDSSDWRTVQTNPCSTNKWLSNFPVVDVMTQPLDVRNARRLFSRTEFYSVKTGGSKQSWRSFWRLANLPSSNSTIRGIRDLSLIHI